MASPGAEASSSIFCHGDDTQAILIQGGRWGGLAERARHPVVLLDEEGHNSPSYVRKAATCAEHLRAQTRAFPYEPPTCCVPSFLSSEIRGRTQGGALILLSPQAQQPQIDSQHLHDYLSHLSHLSHLFDLRQQIAARLSGTAPIRLLPPTL